MEFNPYRRYAMMITVKMITDDYTAVYNIFSEAVDRSQVFIERKIMNLEKKYRIIKISFIFVSCLFFIVLYAIGTYVSERKEEHRFVEPIPVPIALRISVWMMRISFIIYLVIVYLMVHIKSLMNRFSSSYPDI